MPTLAREEIGVLFCFGDFAVRKQRNERKNPISLVYNIRSVNSSIALRPFLFSYIFLFFDAARINSLLPVL
jgi:hypothetical protein